MKIRKESVRHFWVAILLAVVLGVGTLMLGICLFPVWLAVYAVNFFYLAILFEVYQLLRVDKRPSEYLTPEKKKDVLFDVTYGVVGFVGGLLVVWLVSLIF